MIPPSSGTLLIANPFLKDPNFSRSVIFLCEHSPQGSFGFVLNRRIPQTLDQLVEDLVAASFPVFEGGPVQRDTLHFLHQYPQLISGGEEVIEDVFWGGNYESLVASFKQNHLDKDHIRFFIGYSGWSEGQLDQEMKEESWLTVKATRKLIFDTRPEDIWKNSLRHLGGNYEMMINFPIDPQLN
ncbi:MAG TPA: YqgE/AlgH family protein [Chitinophagaceae bacterium]|nr:YqgE/AlgH family protein [Chitinophagaceae bacterium]